MSNSKETETVEPNEERVNAWNQIFRYNKQQISGGAHFIFGRINWNSRGTTGSRPCSTNPRDFIHLGDCERPNTRYGWVRYHVLHGLLMSFPSKDIAWFTKDSIEDLSDEDIDKLEREFNKVIKHLRKMND